PFGFMRQAQIDDGQAGRGVAHGVALHDAGTELDSIHRTRCLGRRSRRIGGVLPLHRQAFAGSCCDLRASSFSTRFIMFDAPVSALSRLTVR
ncbi:MAG: hypothetical protein RLZZ584_82, partial [Pseudomonadota bacterium]